MERQELTNYWADSAANEVIAWLKSMPAHCKKNICCGSCICSAPRLRARQGKTAISTADDFLGDAVEDTFRLLKARRSVDLRIEPHAFLPADFDAKNPFAAEFLRTGIRII